MVSRSDRDSLIEVIEQYLNEELTAFPLDERLSEIGSRTQDETVIAATGIMSAFYDDVQDHKVVATKQQWDLIQRVLLLLRSNAELVMEEGQSKYTVRQAIAVLCLAAFAVAVLKMGFDRELILVTFPLGLVSIFLSVWESASTGLAREAAALAPFGSLPELRSVRRTVRDFAKRPYPRGLEKRRVWSPVTCLFMAIHSYVGVLLYSPLVLALQTWPEKEHKWKVVNSEA